MCVCVNVVSSALVLGTSFKSETGFMNIQSPNKELLNTARTKWLPSGTVNSNESSHSHGTCYLFIFFNLYFILLSKTTGARGQVEQENSIGLFSFQAPWRVCLCFIAGWCHLYFDCMWEAAGFRRHGSDSPHDPDEPRICHTLQGGNPFSHTDTQLSSISMSLWDGSVVFL